MSHKDTSRRWRKRELAAAVILTTLGCAKMAGDVVADAFGNSPASDAVRAVSAVSHVSPAPKVFTAQDGYETYAARFYLTAADITGTANAHALELTPAVNARLGGPYNRRNAYGAAISYGPVLHANANTRPMFNAAFRYAFCHPGPHSVLNEVGLPRHAPYFEVHIESRSQAAPHLDSSTQRPMSFRVTCATGEVVALQEGV